MWYNFFCLDLLLFSRKFAKTVQPADHFKYGGHSCAEYQCKNFALEKCKIKVARLDFLGGIPPKFELCRHE